MRSIVFFLMCLVLADSSAGAEGDVNQSIRAFYHFHDGLGNSIVYYNGKFDVDRSTFPGDMERMYTNADFLARTFTIELPNGQTVTPPAGFLGRFTPEITQRWNPDAKRTLAERWTATTRIESIDLHGDKATVHGSHEMLFQTLAKDYTYVMNRGFEVFEDRLERSPSGWRIAHERIVSTLEPQLLAARPSPIAMSQLKMMHDTNSMIRAFNTNVNYSNCYNSNAMADRDEASRVQACSP